MTRFRRIATALTLCAAGIVALARTTTSPDARASADETPIEDTMKFRALATIALSVLATLSATIGTASAETVAWTDKCDEGFYKVVDLPSTTDIVVVANTCVHRSGSPVIH